MPGQQIEVAELRADFVASAARFVAAARQADRAMERNESRSRRLERQYTRFNTAAETQIRRLVSLRGAIGLALGGGVIARAVSDSAELGAELIEVSRVTGLTVEDLQGVRRVLEGDGINIGATNKLLQTFQRRIGEARVGLSTYVREFDALDIDAADLGSDTLDNLLLVAERLQDIDDLNLRSRIGLTLFGREGARATEIFQRLGRDGLEVAVQDMIDLGVVSRENSEDLKDLLQVGTDLRNQFQAGLAEAIGESAEELGELARQLGERIPGAAERFAAVVETGAENMDLLVEGVRLLIVLRLGLWLRDSSRAAGTFVTRTAAAHRGVGLLAGGAVALRTVLRTLWPFLVIEGAIRGVRILRGEVGDLRDLTAEAADDAEDFLTRLREAATIRPAAGFLDELRELRDQNIAGPEIARVLSEAISTGLAEGIEIDVEALRTEVTGALEAIEADGRNVFGSRGIFGLLAPDIAHRDAIARLHEVEAILGSIDAEAIRLDEAGGFAGGVRDFVVEVAPVLARAGFDVLSVLRLLRTEAPMTKEAIETAANETARIAENFTSVARGAAVRVDLTIPDREEARSEFEERARLAAQQRAVNEIRVQEARRQQLISARALVDSARLELDLLEVSAREYGERVRQRELEVEYATRLVALQADLDAALASGGDRATVRSILDQLEALRASRDLWPELIAAAGEYADLQQQIAEIVEGQADRGIRVVEQVTQTLTAAAIDYVTSVFDELDDRGQRTADRLRNIFRSLARQFISAGFSSIFGQGGGVTFAQQGGPVPAGGLVVGEAGPEFLQLRQPGRVYTNEELAAAVGGAGAGTRIDVTFAPVLSGNAAADAEALDRLYPDFERRFLRTTEALAARRSSYRRAHRLGGRGR